MFDSSSKLDGVRAKIYFKAVPVDQQDGLTYLRVEEAKMDFSVKNIQMGVDNVAGGNTVIREFNKCHHFENMNNPLTCKSLSVQF